MKLLVDTHIHVRLKDITGPQHRKIEKLATIPNSEYEDAIRYGRWIDPTMPRSFYSFDEEDDELVLQRGLLEELLPILKGEAKISWKTSLFDPVGFTWAKKMQKRRYQKTAVDRLTSHNCGVLVAPTGSGKTNIMIRAIHKLQQPTIILVHRNFLANQWRSRIKEYLGYDCGIIGEGKWRIKNITIAMIQTLYSASDAELAELRDRFGLVIADECHHTPAHTWQTVMGAFNAHYRLGCSATPVRKDRMQKILFNSIGPVRHIISDRVTTESGSVLPVTIEVVRTNFFGRLANSRLNFGKMVKMLVSNQARNKIIIKKIIANRKHSQMVLSDRIEHLRILHKLLAEEAPDIPSALVYGAIHGEDREQIFTQVKNGDIMVLFASSIADEGLDIPQLSKLHMVFPTRNPMRNRQQIGRVRRPYGHKKEGTVYDYYDWKNPTLKRQFQERRSFYRAEGYRVSIPGEGPIKSVFRPIQRLT